MLEEMADIVQLGLGTPPSEEEEKKFSSSDDSEDDDFGDNSRDVNWDGVIMKSPMRSKSPKPMSK